MVQRTTGGFIEVDKSKGKLRVGPIQQTVTFSFRREHPCMVRDCDHATFPGESFCGKHDHLNDLERDMKRAQRQAKTAFWLCFVACAANGVSILVWSLQ